tara:strand:+ start:5887 stop:6618 length:732 start_codon:yes stop_codon:yes gene_type:complete
MSKKNLTRINKYLSEIGYCSRRFADKLIENGKVKINGEVPLIGTKISEKDQISVNGKILQRPYKKKMIYLAFNKPIGIVCTTDVIREKDNIIDYINYPTRIFPIGRLDKLSEGLIFLTNDGDIVNKILRDRNNHEKEYEVSVDKKVTKDFINKMQNGLPILDVVTKKCKVIKTGNKKFTIILTQGLNRQIRRMCEYLGYTVKKLKRVRIMNLKLDVKLGQYRNFTSNELAELTYLLQDSSKTF